MWKCSSLKPSATPFNDTSSMSLTSSLMVIPNFELSPPEAARPSRFKNFLDDFMELIHLDRVNADIGISITGLFDRFTECRVELSDARAKKILKSDEQRKLDSLLPQVLNNLIDINANRVAQYRTNSEVPFFIDVEIRFTPERDSIQVFRIFNRPDIFFG